MHFQCIVPRLVDHVLHRHAMFTQAAYPNIVRFNSVRKHTGRAFNCSTAKSVERYSSDFETPTCPTMCCRAVPSLSKEAVPDHTITERPDAEACWASTVTVILGQWESGTASTSLASAGGRDSRAALKSFCRPVWYACNKLKTIL
jgi:hypothetical protein